MAKYEPKVVEGMVKALKLGLTVEDACDANDISKQTHYVWLKQYPDYNDAIKRAKAQGEEHLLTKIAEHGDKSWQALAWILERTRTEKYGLRTKQEITGKDGAPFTIKIEGLDNKDY